MTAATTDAICVIEVAYEIMAPVTYIPRLDICADLRMTERRTQCPLKGDAAYFDLVGENGKVVAEEVAWAYVDTFDFAAGLRDRMAFNPRVITIETKPF